MTSDPADPTAAVLTRSGGVAHRRAILAAGVTPWELGRSVHSGRIRRVRQAWYSTPDAAAEVVAAVRVGGTLTAVSAARHRGWWARDDGLLHVALPRNASRLRSAAGAGPDTGSVRGVCRHWTKEPGVDLAAIDAPTEALLRFAECQPLEAVVAVIDSALNERAVRLVDLRDAGGGERFRSALSRCDGRSQSGTESIVRHRLRALGLRVRIQVHFPGVGRVDILVGDRLVIECDSMRHHTSAEDYERDRTRDLRLAARDVVVLRLSYRQVVSEWSTIEEVVLKLVRTRAHRARRRAALVIQEEPRAVAYLSTAALCS